MLTLRWQRSFGFVSNYRRASRRQTVIQVAETLETRCLLTVPAFSSLPGADHTILLDFDGQTVENTSWNSYYNQTSLVAPAYDIDGNSSTFSTTELARITEAWKRTAEDFAPFNVNVTTVDPGVEALRKSGTGDTQWGVRVIMTNEANMVTDPNERTGAGGIAYIDSFNWSSDTPVWVFTTGGKSIAEAASHEVGHSLGLSHDGLSGGASYYSGHGSGETGWASIMGVGYYQNVSQWDKGEYYNSNNGGSGANYGDGPDDLAIITGTAGPGNGFGYRADDHGNSNGTASSIGLSGTTVSDSGIIETTSDVDVFSFTTGAGTVTLNINPFTPGPNLDVRADLYNGAGNLVATSNESTVLAAGFSLNLAAGQYFLHVDGTGWGSPGSSTPTGYSEYASLGQYTVSGSIVDPGGLPSVSIGDASANESDGSITFTLNLSAASATATSVDWTTVNGSAVRGSDFVAAGGTATFAVGATSATVTINLVNDSIYESTESFSVALSNPNGITINDGSGVGTITDDDPQPLPTISISDASVNEGKFFTKGKNKNTAQLTNMTFTVSLSAASSQSVTVNYATTDGTATTANNDYQSAAGTVTFAPGETSKTVTVTIVGDNTQESDETFGVNLGNAANATIADGAALGTILDDDSGGGKGGGGGKGKGGGKPNKSASEASPMVHADPSWWFEGPSSFDVTIEDAGHDVQDDFADANLAERELAPVDTFLVLSHSVMEVASDDEDDPVVNNVRATIAWSVAESDVTSKLADDSEKFTRTDYGDTSDAATENLDALFGIVDSLTLLESLNVL
ncbi:MAG: hypothetical protein O3A00_09280 [Planctomycetota bacterium]|nr:hypothetical protein [Planctomycetota bacterium]